MLGYEVDFGHMEAMALISSQKFAEKQVGYIVVSVMLNEVCILAPTNQYITLEASHCS